MAVLCCNLFCKNKEFKSQREGVEQINLIHSTPEENSLQYNYVEQDVT